MKDNRQNGEYLAPEVKVMEIKSRGILCQSQLKDYQKEPWADE